MNIPILSLIFLLIIVVIVCISKKPESFDIPLRSSSAWDWNLGPGYGAGYGTGYAMWGIWPANLPTEPWRNWMWGRRPLIFTKPFTPAPQIDYNDAPDSDSKPVSNYNISLLPQDGDVVLAVNGFARQTLQLDRNRNYYFHIYTPGVPFTINDGSKDLFAPIEQGSIQLNFDNSDPDVLSYHSSQGLHKGGTIYLNSTRWI